MGIFRIDYFRNRKWAFEDEFKLKDLWLQGLPVPSISKEMNRSRNSIIGKAFRMGLPKHAEAKTKGPRQYS